MATISGPIVPVGRGDTIIAYHVYRADDLATTRALRDKDAAIAALRLTVAAQAGRIAELEQALAARPRWYAVRVPAWRAPEWALGPLALLAGLGAAIDAAWDCRPGGE